VQHEFEVLGFDRKYRPSLFEEGVEIILHAWEDGRIGYEGKRWRFEDLPFGPRPERPPPIYIGAFADPAIDRAARLGDGFLASAGGGEFAPTYRKVQEALTKCEQGDEDFPYVASGVAYVREDWEQARTEVGPAIAYQRSRYAEWSTDRDEPEPQKIQPEDLPWERYFVSTPDEVARGLIQVHREAPYDHVCFWGRLPGITHEQALESQRLFVSEVDPEVRDAVKA